MSLTKNSRIMLGILGGLVVVAAVAGIAAATPSTGLTPTVLGTGTFEEKLRVNTRNIQAKFKRPSDFVLLDLAVAPGGHTGWHSHPGPALVVVKEGTFTLYDGDDRRCRAHRYGQGEAFVDAGAGHVHIGRNETASPVKLLVTFIVPRGAETFIDAPDPGNCTFTEPSQP